MQGLLVLLAAVSLLAGCLLRSAKTAPVTEQQSVGRGLDGLFRGTTEIAGDVGKIKHLAKKSAVTALKKDEIKQLARSVVRGGSEAIAEFKSAAVGRIDELIAGVVETTARRTRAAVATMANAQRTDYAYLLATNDFAGAAAYLKKHTNLARDRILKRQIELYNRHLDEVAEIIADNHVVANNIGQLLANDAAVKKLGIEVDALVSQLKIGKKDTKLATITDAVLADFRVTQQLTGIDLWDKLAHLELMLRRTDNGKPIYTEIRNMRQLRWPFNKTFTMPVGDIDKNSNYLKHIYGENLEKQVSDGKLLEQMLREYPSPN